MKNRFAFTLIEIIIAVVVLSILSAIGAISWDTMVDKTRQDICEQNQTILTGALKFYIYDNQAAPTSLSSIYPKYTNFALAKMKKDHPITYAKRAISLALLRANQPKDAVAAGPNFKNYLGMQTSVLHCPEDSNGGISYGMHKVFDQNAISAEDVYDKCVEIGQVIIGDCDDKFFSNASDLVGRHGNTMVRGNQNISVYCTANGNAGKFKKTAGLSAGTRMESAEYIHALIDEYQPTIRAL